MSAHGWNGTKWWVSECSPSVSGEPSPRARPCQSPCGQGGEEQVSIPAPDSMHGNNFPRHCPLLCALVCWSFSSIKKCQRCRVMRTDPLPKSKRMFQHLRAGRPTGSTSVLEVSNMWEASAYEWSLRNKRYLFLPCPHVIKECICWDEWKIQCRRPEHTFWPMVRKMDSKWNSLRSWWRWFTPCKSEDPTRPYFAETGAEQDTEQAPTCQECPLGISYL